MVAPQTDTGIFTFKRCPECLSNIPIHVGECPECQQKVGPPDKRGVATKPVNWTGYLSAAILWIVFGVFMWWAFFKT